MIVLLKFTNYCNNSAYLILVRPSHTMQHFHATIVIQHVSRNKINFMPLISYNKTCFMPNTSCLVQQV